MVEILFFLLVILFVIGVIYFLFGKEKIETVYFLVFTFTLILIVGRYVK